MAVLRLDPEQRFTCQQCGRCCRRGWDIALSVAEVEAYRRAHAEHWYRETEAAPEGAERDPFEPIPRHAFHMRIRKRVDGACGFLSPENRCRIHEELGADKKPLTCRLFPFRFHPADGPPLVTASFCCPTVVANKGETLVAQSHDLAALGREWLREHPEGPPAEILFVPGRPITGATLGALQRALHQMLDRRGQKGPPDLRQNLRRMAVMLEDLSRHRVVRLPDEGFAEYLELTGGYAATSERPLSPRAPSRLGRLLFRGFLFVAAAARLQTDDRSSGLRLSLRLRLFRLLAHVHGLGPAVAGFDLRAARRAALRLDDPALHSLAYNYLRASLETLGTGRRPVLDELAVSVAFLNVGLVLAAMRADQAGRGVVDGAALSEGLMEAVDLSHAETSGALGAILTTLAGGVESLYLFAAGPPLGTAAEV